MRPADVLWIGSGKSSVGKALSRRRGIQLYNVDHRTQAHAARQARGRVGCSDEIELSLEEYEAISAAGDRWPLRRPRP